MLFASPRIIPTIRSWSRRLKQLKFFLHFDWTTPPSNVGRILPRGRKFRQGIPLRYAPLLLCTCGLNGVPLIDQGSVPYGRSETFHHASGCTGFRRGHEGSGATLRAPCITSLGGTNSTPTRQRRNNPRETTAHPPEHREQDREVREGEKNWYQAQN